MEARHEDNRYGSGQDLAGIVRQADAGNAYRAAVAEFDRMWETGRAKQAAERMRQLLTVIETFEQNVSQETD